MPDKSNGCPTSIPKKLHIFAEAAHLERQSMDFAARQAWGPFLALPFTGVRLSNPLFSPSVPRPYTQIKQLLIIRLLDDLMI